MSRILLFGDLAGTGFGTVTMDLGRALLARGEDVRFLSQNELVDLPEPFKSRTTALGGPNGWLSMGWYERAKIALATGAKLSPAEEQTIERDIARFEGMFTGALFDDGWTPESAIILGDVGSLKLSPLLGFVPAGFPAFHYVPIEGIDLPPRWGAIWRHLRPVAMSEFGATEIERVTGARPPVVYHGVDAHVFRPVSAIYPLRAAGHLLRTKAECRALFTDGPVPADRTWLLRTDRHMPRKRYNALLRSLVPVFAARPKVDLVVHCLTADQGGDLRDTLSKFPAWFQARVLLTGLHDRYGGVPREILVALYNAADLYVSNSAEGFGLTIAESLACGVPAVGVGYSSVPEVIGPAGALVAEGGLIDNEYDHFWWAADEDAFGAAVADLLDHPLRREHLGTKGPDHVRRHFRWDRAAEQFSKLVADALAGEVAA